MAKTPRKPSTPRTQSAAQRRAPDGAAERNNDAEGAINERTEARGQGGEIHQIAAGETDTLTTQQGAPIADDQNSLRAGARGPGLLEDHVLREKLFHFDHERIPERVVHARGFGAHGYFECDESLSRLTSADLFQERGDRTPVFVRFSTVVGNKGSADLARDVRGFAVKFYTRDGNWDLVGNNIPVFFIQDAMKFPDLVHAAKPEPDRGFPQATAAHDNFWDFISLTPEATHTVAWIMSDRAIPRSFRFMEGFGVHTFKLVDAKGRATFVKFHWKPKLGLQSVTWPEALVINGADPDFHRRDLWSAIQAGDFPEWELGIQVLDESVIERFEFDILDPTKLVPEELAPVQRVGRMVLDRCVDNFFAETEQVAFCTQNIVPGIDFSDDPLLQGRNFSYLDTQLKRLGSPNFTHIPINAPRTPVRNFQQDGHMAMRAPHGRANYEPNSWSGDEGGPRENPRTGFTSHAVTVSGTKERRRPETFADHYSQARQFYISQTEVEQQHIANALVFELSKVEKIAIRERMVSHIVHMDKGLADEVSERLGLARTPKPAKPALQPKDDLPASDALSILKNARVTLEGRKLGVLVSEGTDAKLFKAVQSASKKAGAMIACIAPRAGGVADSDGNAIHIDQIVLGGPSALYDAVVLLVTESAAEDLAQLPPARAFVADAFAHKKFIGYAPEAVPLMNAAGVAPDADQAVIRLNKANAARDFVEAAKAGRFWARM